MYRLNFVCWSQYNLLKWTKTELVQLTAPYSMLDKIPTMEPEPYDLIDEPVKAVKSSKQMRLYLQQARDHKEFMDSKKTEFEVGRRHLANMMGADPESFNQERIDEAIEYLFPCGLFVKQSRPFMKPPEEVFPPKKEAQFDETGRPFHPLFYTRKPFFYQILHDAANYLKELNDLEDKVIAGLSDEKSRPIELKATEWLSKELLEKRIMEKLYDEEYDNFKSIMERLLQHPYGFKKENFILDQRNTSKIAFAADEKLPVSVVIHTKDNPSVIDHHHQ